MKHGLSGRLVWAHHSRHYKGQKPGLIEFGNARERPSLLQLGPASRPTTTAVVFLLTADPDTLPPRRVMASAASSRLIASIVP